jgi:hypothetical protein
LGGLHEIIQNALHMVYMQSYALEKEQSWYLYFLNVC